MIHKKIITVFALLVIITLNNFAQESSERITQKEKIDVQIIEATVQSIDHATRMVTLRGPAGNLVTLEVGEAVERLDEVEEGDLVTAEFATYILAEFRNPTIEELVEPLVVIEEAEKAGYDDLPYAAAGTMFRAVVTIEIINRPDMLVTVRGPQGNYLTIEAEDEQLIQQLNVGEVGVLTYAEMVALNLKKLEK